MSRENERVSMRFFDEVCNGRKLDVAEELFTAEHVYHDPSSPWVGPGPDGMKQLTSVYQSGFPDAHWTVDAMVSTSDTVITRWIGSGTHQGELSGIAPTGKQVRVQGIWIHHFANGKIVES